jgi:hypothetical protein
MKKVFIIGFNRTATKALHELFTRSNYMSTHYSCMDLKTGNPVILACQMKENLDSYKPILDGLGHFQVFSDMFWHREDIWIDGNKYYKQLHNEYPDAYFILNTRNMNDWLNSRVNHKNGAYIKRCMEYYNMDESELLEHFEEDRNKTEKEMISYFENNDRFLHFDINKDPIQNVIDLVKPDFFIKEKDWTQIV